ncbi:hypothetical protein J1N35_025769 [Gossypium stocksii]|uniref:Hydrophobic seed protein domain-containing protein n=1 Tax=Gossypium stocksii TaxID=47602 RepID=A0A9D3ZY04_9ROSI|nr:hypothetical protein J1N35_025769 [Gossypium stocksii]
MVTSTSVPCPPPPPKTPKSPSRPSFNGNAPSCSKGALKLEVCANVLNDLVHLVIGTPPKMPCHTIIQGLVDFEATVCLCTAIKANVLGINLKIPISLSLLLNYCGKGVPQGFQCA